MVCESLTGLAWWCRSRIFLGQFQNGRKRLSGKTRFPRKLLFGEIKSIYAIVR